MTRKYPSKQKTTTPEGYREYKKLQMRDYRKTHMDRLQFWRNRAGYLEMEVERLNNAIQKQ